MGKDASGYFGLIRETLLSDYEGMFREAGDGLEYPFLTPGSGQYADVLWDWDSWLSNVALRQILLEVGDAETSERAKPYERGCVLNFLDWTTAEGWAPISIGRPTKKRRPENPYERNMHKPCLAQHAAFLAKLDGGDAEWLRENEGFYALQRFVNNYRNHHRHECGVYY
jgi:putative isomerase